jgi:transposase-like protein
MARHRSFSFEFKRQVVLDFLEGRTGMRELARQHSLSRNLIRLWIQKYEAGQLTDEVADGARIAEYEAKIAELERKVGQLTSETGEWVFPSAESKTCHLASPKHAWERIRKAAHVPDVRLHDLRRTLGRLSCAALDL